MTVADLVEAAASRLRAAGVPKPRREANRLWAWVNRVSPGEAYFSRERHAAGEPARAFEAAVERRAAGEPMAYVLGHCGFRKLELGCDRRALIPRPESEGIVALALERVRSGWALDIGTGTGCLALALADEGAFDAIVATDLSADALSLAAENASRTGLEVRLVRGDGGAPVRGSRFGLIVSNPPYLTETEYQALDASVKRWEPRTALAGGPDGLGLTRRLVREAGVLLAPGGWLVMELDSTRSGAVATLAREAGWVDVAVWDDLFGRARYLTARREHAG